MTAQGLAQWVFIMGLITITVILAYVKGRVDR